MFQNYTLGEVFRLNGSFHLHRIEQEGSESVCKNGLSSIWIPRLTANFVVSILNMLTVTTISASFFGCNRSGADCTILGTHDCRFNSLEQDGYITLLRLALHPRNRTLHPAQLRDPG